MIGLDFAPTPGSQTSRAGFTIAKAPRCRCKCGYTCGGPGVCDLWKKTGLEGMQECIEKHWVKDCDHDFSGPMVRGEMPGGGSFGTVVCQICGTDAMSHDMAVGP